MAFEAIGQHERAALFYRQLGRLDKAADLFKAANKSADAAACLYQIGRFDEAMPLFQRASKPLLAAKCALYAGRRDQAWELLAGVPRSEPGARDFFVELGQAHLAAGEAREAVYLLRELLGQLPVTKETVSSQVLLAQAYQAAGDLIDAQTKWT